MYYVWLSKVTSLPLIYQRKDMNYNELTKKMKQAGWEIARQNGSHVIYKKEGKTVSVPNHGKKDIATGTLQKLLKDTGLK